MRLVFNLKDRKKGGLYAPHSPIKQGERRALCASWSSLIREKGGLYAPHGPQGVPRVYLRVYQGVYLRGVPKGVP